uniref:PTS sugar transporter subunit IIA n=1 Tax=Parerythrobacter lutipelagi TaxID=1964208 RepID=UPI0010F61FAF|nr:PTS sugar transporter subunit IIA [Parerythrobacter lutipelagi]
MDAHFKLLPDAVITAAPESKPAILETVAQHFAAIYGVDGFVVLESLQEREALGSTGFGRGVAIPHARTRDFQRPVAVLLRLEHPVDFAAADGMPVDLVFGLLSPENAGASHLHALAAISRLVRDDAMRQALADATGPEALYALLTNVSDRDAA